MSGGRILLVATEYAPYRGGIARYCTELAAAAVDVGYDVAVVAPSHGAVDDGTGDVTRFVTGAQFSPRDLPAAVRAIRRAARSFGPTVVHASDYRALVAVRLAMPRFPGEAVAVTVYGSEIKGANAWKRAVQRTVYRGTRLLAISRYTDGLLRAALGRGAATVTPLGVRTERFGGDRDRRRVRASFGLGDDTCAVLSVARFEPRKAQDVLARSVAQLAPGLREKVRVLFVGDGDPDYLAAVRRAAAGLDEVTFLGSLDDERLVEAYAAADVFCLPGREHPSRAEGFGLVYLEAAAAGLPVVAARVDAIPEVVRHLETGILVEPDDPAGLARAVERLATDPALRAELGERGRAWAREFRWSRTALASYRGLVASRQSARGVAPRRPLTRPGRASRR